MPEYPHSFQEGDLSYNKKLVQDTHYSQGISSKDFLKLKELGKGTFGVVYLVRCKKDKQLYALKVIEKRLVHEKKAESSTQAEREILRNIRSPFIVGLKYAFQTPVRLYLAMEYISGGQLFSHVQHSGNFTESKAKFYAAELVLALGALHRKDIAYRDLKPENILMDKFGHVKLVDFGLSKLKMKGNKMTYSVVGTVEYMAPEILQGNGYTKACDWWALGIVLYEMVQGMNPYRNSEMGLREKSLAVMEQDFIVNEHWSPELRDILSKLLVREPRERLGGSMNDGYLELQRHPFFKSIDWQALAMQEVEPPFMPDFRKSNQDSFNELDYSLVSICYL